MTTDFPAVCARTSRQLHLSKLARLPEADWREILDAEEAKIAKLERRRDVHDG